MNKKDFNLNQVGTKNPHQLIATICRAKGLAFNLGQLDELVILCESYHKRHDELVPLPF